jgi:hypothetical protein
VGTLHEFNQLDTATLEVVEATHDRLRVGSIWSLLGADPRCGWSVLYAVAVAEGRQRIPESN